MMEYDVKTSNSNRTITLSPTILPDNSACGPNDFVNSQLQAYSLIASAVIVVCLSLLERRSNQTCRCAGQRPGIIYPVNLLDHGCDNFGYAMAFGSVASYCFNLFFGTGIASSAPPWSKSLVLMLHVLLNGFMFYPLFACLTTTWVFVGSLLGLGYTAFWLYFNLRFVITCPDGPADSFTGQNIATQIPVLVCLMCLFLRYGYILIKHSIHVIRARSVQEIIEQKEREHLGTKYNRKYVQELLVPECKNIVISSIGPTTEISYFKRLKIYLRRYVYLNDPSFKYSPRIICIFTVALICTYQVGILSALFAYQLHKLIPMLFPDFNSTDDGSGKLFVNVLDGSLLFSLCVSSLLIIFSIIQILTLYRQNIKRMYKGDFRHLPFRKDNRHPQFILSDSMCYAGSQIAHTLWGYIIVLAMLTITSMAIMYLIVLPVFNLISRDVLKYLWNVLSGVLILQVFMIVQKLFSRVLLQSRTSLNEKGNTTSTVVLALDNRKVYHNVAYFLFFFYIVLGLFGCLVTILKGAILGILYLPRLDQSGLISGFQTWDKGYMYYVSFLYVEECHRHPVLLVFCDILLDDLHDKRRNKLKNYGSNDSVFDIESTRPQRNIVEESNNRTNRLQPPDSFDNRGRRARNRWFKAYTMIRNPGLRDKDVEEEYVLFNDEEVSTNYRRRMSSKQQDTKTDV